MNFKPWWILAFLFLTATGTVVYKMTRGIRNNNPGNIRHGDNWRGMSDLQTDSAFIQFVAPVWGIRAISKILNTYYTGHGLRTVRGIISRWAPPVENDTESYIRSVAAFLGVDSDTVLTFDEEQKTKLIAAIIRHENGVQPYPIDTLYEGVRLA